MSIAGLKNAMRAALRDEPLRRHPDVLRGGRRTVEDIPAFTKSFEAKAECYHCHCAHDAEYAQLRAEGRFVKAMLFRYPLPENLGLTLDVDRNNVVDSVQPGSPAAKAGIRPGAVVARAGDTPVYS